MKRSPAALDAIQRFLQSKRMAAVLFGGALSDACIICEIKLKKKKAAQSLNIMVRIAVFLCLPMNISSLSGSVCK